MTDAAFAKDSFVVCRAARREPTTNDGHAPPATESEVRARMSQACAIPECRAAVRFIACSKFTRPRSATDPILALRGVRSSVGDSGWSSVMSGHTMSLAPSDVSVLERLLMLAAVALIAFGIGTVIF